MTRQQDRTSFADPNHRYRMDERLAQEAKQKSDVQLLFSPNFIEDISDKKSERKLGVDFLLTPLGELGAGDANFEPIRVENKFEQYATRRVDYELVSVDRPNLVPGWMYTSTAAWVCSWFPSGELLAVHMAELRALILPRPGMFQSTTTGNLRYLSWNVLPNFNLVLDRCPSARVVNLCHDLGETYGERPMLERRHKGRVVSSEELVLLMQTMPRKTDPVPISRQDLISVMQMLRPNNFRKLKHASRIDELPYLRQAA